MYLFFDVETTGLNPHIDRVAQLAFLLCDNHHAEILRFSKYIKPDGWEIKDEQWYLDNGYTIAEAFKKGGFFTENNMSTQQCKLKGIPIYDALRVFQDALKQCEFKIAHNMAFDNRFILKEQERLNIVQELFRFKKGYCTMLKSTNYCKIPNKWNSGYKWPKLSELHNKLFNKDFDGAHDAFYDVKAMAKCFFELRERKIL